MDIQAINTLFKDITESVTGLKSYAFGWPSDRVRSYDTEADEVQEYPRVFLQVPTLTSNQITGQDLYNVTIYFDTLQGYDNEGNEIADTQLKQWSDLQTLAAKWFAEFKARHLERESDYIGLTSPLTMNLDSFAGMQRLVSIQISFEMVTPTICAITIGIKNASASLSGVGTIQATAQAVKQASAILTANSAVLATLDTGKVIIYAEATLQASGELSAQGKLAKQVVANVSTSTTIGANTNLGLSIEADLQAISTMDNIAQIAKIASLLADATATVQAIATAETQGVAYAVALLSAQGDVQAALSIAKQVQADFIGNGNVTASATVARVITAILTTDAILVATAQAVKVAVADLDAMAETTLNAVISRSVTATLEAFATTDLQAIISKSVQATVNATANTSVIAVLANQCVALLSAAGTLSATAKKAVYRSASLSAAGTLSATGTVISGAVTDPYFANVSLLLHMDGANNGTSFPDSSSNNITMVRSGAVTTKTAIFKFGTASVFFPGSAYLYAADSELWNWGSGNFTVEFWLYPTIVNKRELIIAQSDTSGGNASIGILIEKTVTNKLRFLLVASGGGTVFDLSSSANLNSTGVWQHIACVRDGSLMRVFIDGTQSGTLAISGTLVNSTFPFLIGSSSFGNAFTGYVDDLRITKGVARYTANFTPPTEAFPNS